MSDVVSARLCLGVLHFWSVRAQQSDGEISHDWLGFTMLWPYGVDYGNGALANRDLGFRAGRTIESRESELFGLPYRGSWMSLLLRTVLISWL